MQLWSYFSSNLRHKICVLDQVIQLPYVILINSTASRHWPYLQLGYCQFHPTWVFVKFYAVNYCVDAFNVDRLHHIKILNDNESIYHRSYCCSLGVLLVIGWLTKGQTSQNTSNVVSVSISWRHNRNSQEVQYTPQYMHKFFLCFSHQF